MSDLIDREALKDAVKRYASEPIKEKDRKCQAICLDMLGIIDAQPAAPRWHMVEDELPDDGEWAIFTNGKVITVERFKLDAYNHFFPASQWFDFEDVIAWMPLPEPPKEDA